ncbi:hypothetical protein KKH38_02490 [Patescibacteria group bacterium]|nr:hypothetical protein [Patescibacteria group bacterium]MBU4601381.1 hypothetical protein [Patescibacteria group bacterium]MCG2698269.1 hypothetical protein [Candidatus Parcubacteria bacterium]
MNFFIKYKKIILAASFVLIVFLLGYFLYIMFFKPAAPAPITTEEEAGGAAAELPIASVGTGQIIESAPGAGLPAEKITAPAASKTAKGGLTQVEQLNDAPGLYATLSGSGSGLQYYNKSDGKFYKVDNGGKIIALSDKVFFQVESAVWSPDKNKAILEYPDGANILYDFNNNRQTTLPAHWKDFNFSPSGQQIVMKSMGLDPDNRWLAISNADGSKTRRVEALGGKDDTVYSSWSPNNQSIAMYTEGIDFDRQEVFLVGLNNENFKSMVIEGRGFQSKWSPKGDKLLYSVYSSANDLKPMLWIANAQGESIGAGRKSFGVETWADKCAFADSINVYCAVPEKLEEGAGLFPEMAKNTKDNLYKIDAQTGLKKLVAVPDGSYNMSNIIISDDGKYLYFTDATSGRLYKIDLK